MESPIDFRSAFDLLCSCAAAKINVLNNAAVVQLINASLYKNWGRQGLRSNSSVDTLDYSAGDCVGGDPFVFFKIAFDADDAYARIVELWLGMKQQTSSISSRMINVTAPIIAAKQRYDLELSSGFYNNITPGLNEGVFDAVVNCSNSHKCAVIDTKNNRRLLLMSLADGSSTHLLDLLASSRYLQMHVVPLLMKHANTRCRIEVKDFTNDSEYVVADVTSSIDKWIVGKIPEFQKIIDQSDTLITSNSLRVIPSACLPRSDSDVQIRFNVPTLVAVFNTELCPEFMQLVM